ncbi:FadR/GntR family transcriptional regulator [Salinibacillus aidingensis]|uniref:FadR/GntR family transcriptional regulator n=1 Tax=Salinibacillus aidingensis TaxID=237684 RepID=A0ABP3LC91_9BACI
MEEQSGLLKMKSVKRKTLSEQVIDQIIELLMTGQLKPGDKLPSEMELMEMLYVSRPVLREAMSSLETVGVVHRKTKEGTFFSDRIGSNPFRIMLALSAGDIESIMETRLSQELGLVTLAAEKISDESLEKLAETIKVMEEKEENYNNADKEFHRIIAHSASNSITEGIIDPLLNMFDETLGSVSLNHRNKELTVQQHKDIYNALAKRDPIETYICMYRHLDNVRQRMFKSIHNK